MPTYRYEVGDHAKVVKQENDHGFEIGDTVRIVEQIPDFSDCYRARSVTTDEVWAIHADELADQV